MRLSRSDLEGILAFVAEAGQIDGADPFPPEFLSGLASLVRCDDVAYCEVDRVTRKTTAFACFGTATCVPEEEELYWATVDAHPIRNHRAETGDLGACKISDFISPRQLRRTQFYGEYMRLINPGGFLMSVCLPAPPGHTRTFTLERACVDFGERERTLLDVLQPHFLNQRRKTELHRRGRAALSTLDGVLTERETEILHRVAEGMRNHEIARALWIAPGTVRKHLDNIYAKLEVHNRAAAVSRLSTESTLETSRLRPRPIDPVG